MSFLNFLTFFLKKSSNPFKNKQNNLLYVVMVPSYIHIKNKKSKNIYPTNKKTKKKSPDYTVKNFVQNLFVKTKNENMIGSKMV